MPPTLLEPPRLPRVSKSLYRGWNWRRQVVASGFRLTALALLVLLGWAGWYLANRGFSREWRTTVANELRKRGVEASVRRLTLDPLRGLVADYSLDRQRTMLRDVRVRHATHERNQPADIPNAPVQP